MTRRPDHIPARKAIPKATKLAVFARSGGKCEAEGCDRAGREIDHIKAVALGGGNEPENLRLLCRAHHVEKSAADVDVIAEADRKGGRSGQYARRNKAKAAGTHKPIPSRGFDKTLRKRMDGTVERRQP